MPKGYKKDQKNVEPELEKKARAFIITNYDLKSWEDYMDKAEVKNPDDYIICQLEKGDLKQRDHYQICWITKNETCGRILQDKVGTKFHIEVAKKQGAVQKYCSKLKTRLKGPFEFNPKNKPKGQGHRTDWDTKRDICKKRKIEALGEDPELVMKYTRAYDIAHELHGMELSHIADWKIERTKTSFKEYIEILEKKLGIKPRDIYILRCRDKEKGLYDWDGYDDHPHVVIPDPSALRLDNNWIFEKIRVPIYVRWSHKYPKTNVFHLID